jgi:hypothetical protein
MWQYSGFTRVIPVDPTCSKTVSFPSKHSFSGRMFWSTSLASLRTKQPAQCTYNQ